MVVRVFALSTLYNPDIASASFWTLLSLKRIAKEEFLNMKVFTKAFFV